MWIHHIGQIGIGLFIGLIGIHLGLHFYFKAKKRQQDAQKTADKQSSAENIDNK